MPRLFLPYTLISGPHEPTAMETPQRVHGLLECTNEDCVAECNGRSKKWNRDLLAVLNFRRIWGAHVDGDDRPEGLRPM